MAHKLTVKLLKDIYFTKSPNSTTVILEAPSKDELFARFFKEFDNRYKYSNNITPMILEPELRKEYSEWIGNIDNYIKHGGDMW